MVRPLTRARVLGLVLAAGLVPLLLAAPAQAVPDRMRIVTHNIQGGQLHQGSEAALAPVYAQIDSFNPHGVMLQEVCSSQYAAFTARYPGWATAWNDRRGNSKCGTGGRIGELVASPVAVATYAPQKLHDDARHPGWTYALACLDMQTTHAPARLCSTHLAAGKSAADAEARLKQARGVRKYSAAPIAAGMSTIVAGDFNSRPGERALDPISQINRTTGEANGNGDFWESDQGDRDHWTAACKAARRSYCRSGEATFYQQKKDHIFISRNVTNAVDLTEGHGWATVVTVPLTQSDHHILKATFDVYE